MAAAFLAHPAWASPRWLALGAAGLFASMIVYTVLLLVPINNQVARWRPESLPADWRELRWRWDRLHAFRVGMLLAALALLVASSLVRPDAFYEAAEVKPSE